MKKGKQTEETDKEAKERGKDFIVFKREIDANVRILQAQNAIKEGYE